MSVKPRDKASPKKKKGGWEQDPETGRMRGGNRGNSGGKKGRSGRRADRFKELCANLTLRATRLRVKKILRNPDHPFFMQAIKWTSEHGFGKPKESMELSVGKPTLEAILGASRRSKDGDAEDE